METREGSVQKMQANLIRYTRANDKRMVLRSLKEVKFLSSLILDPVQSSECPLPDLEKEVGEEIIVLNGIPFKPVGMNADGKPRSGKDGANGSLPLIKGVLQELCDGKDVNVTSLEAYEQLIIRLARTTGSADPYFRMNALLGSADLLVMPISPGSLRPQKSSAILNAASKDEDAHIPVHLTLYESEGNVHMSLSQTFQFGLFRKSDVKPGRPWIILNALVTERANFSNGQSIRQLNVNPPNIY